VDGVAPSEMICYAIDGEDQLMEGHSGRGIYLVAGLVALFVIGWIVVKALATLVVYGLVGLVVVLAGSYLFRRVTGARRNRGPSTRRR
jgi:hypothetical protein